VVTLVVSAAFTLLLIVIGVAIRARRPREDTVSSALLKRIHNRN
jgi:hypothetical protein